MDLVGIGKRTTIGQSHLYRGGLGIFASYDLTKGDVVAFYGAWPITNEEASTLLMMGAWTHIARNVVTGQCLLGAEYDALSHLPVRYREGKGQLANAADLLVKPSSKAAGWWQDRYWWLLTPDERVMPRTEGLLPEFTAGGLNIERNVKATYPPESTILLIATRNIKQGEEILWEYGVDYWTRMHRYSLQHPQLLRAQKGWWNTRKHFIYTYTDAGDRLGPPHLKVTLTTACSRWSEEYSVHVDAVEALLAFATDRTPLPPLFIAMIMKIDDYDQQLSSKRNALYRDGALVGYIASSKTRPVCVTRDQVSAAIAQLVLEDVVYSLLDAA
jgi:hypothetical protein